MLGLTCARSHEFTAKVVKVGRPCGDLGRPLIEFVRPLTEFGRPLTEFGRPLTEFGRPLGKFGPQRFGLPAAKIESFPRFERILLLPDDPWLEERCRHTDFVGDRRQHALKWRVVSVNRRS